MKHPRQEIEKSLIRVLAVCSRCTTLHAVAQKMNTHQSTVARRIETLERRLGYQVINRTSDGFTLTEAGLMLAPKAREIEKMLLSFERDAALMENGQVNTITIQAPEGLGIHWISPCYAQQSELRGVSLNIICSDNLPNLATSMVDMSIQYTEATTEDHTQIILGYLQMLPFASRNYVAEYGVPQTLADLKKHRIISQVGPHGSLDIWSATLDGDELSALQPATALQTNSGTSQYHAVKASLGIGGLPTYGVTIDPDLVPIDLGIVQRVPIYLVYQQRRIRDQAAFNKTVRWVKEIFEQAEHPFFLKDYDQTIKNLFSTD